MAAPAAQAFLAANNFALTGRLVLGAARLELISDGLLAGLLSLGPVNSLHENAFCS